MKQSASQDTKRPNLQRYFFTSSIHAGAVQSSVPSVTDTQVAATMSPLHWLLYVSGQYKLPIAFVIFICDYDPVGSQLYRYTLFNLCKENAQIIPNGSHTIWLSTKGKNDSDEPKELVNFLKYVESPDKTENSEDDDSEYQEQLFEEFQL